MAENGIAERITPPRIGAANYSGAHVQAIPIADCKWLAPAKTAPTAHLQAKKVETVGIEPTSTIA